MSRQMVRKGNLPRSEDPFVRDSLVASGVVLKIAHFLKRSDIGS